MKTLLLMRHGKSDWSNTTVIDADRPLAKRGIKDSKRISRALVRFDHTPDMVVCSPALRATQTAGVVSEECRLSRPVVLEESLYPGGTEEMLNIIRRFPPEIERPLIIGHNPAVEETAGGLLTGGKSDGITFPTAALLCILCGSPEWRSFDPDACSLLWFLIPRLLKAVS